ncbi:MAG TPA: hypothetical protein VGI66_06140 [Streptosporangiaceae bacterium]
MSRRTAAPAPSPRTAAEPDPVHAWRVSQLVRLGLAWLVADAIADHLDWHEVAKLVRRGCPASLAVAIIA